MPIIAFLEGVELAVVSATICIDLGFLISIQDASHCPLTVYEAGIAHLEINVCLAARTPDATHFFLNRKYSEAFIHDNELLVGHTFLVLTVTQPRKTICDFSIPGCIIFPIYFFNVLNCVESKVNP